MTPEKLKRGMDIQSRLRTLATFKPLLDKGEAFDLDHFITEQCLTDIQTLAEKDVEDQITALTAEFEAR